MTTDSDPDTDREEIPYANAVAMLPEGERVHTVRNSLPGVMLGADWDRPKLLTWIKEHGVEKSGPTASAMHHGLAGRDDRGWLFIETKE